MKSNSKYCLYVRMKSEVKRKELSYSLSMKSSSLGIPVFSPLRFLIPSTTWKALVPESIGSWARVSQWSNTHCGKAWPEVELLKWAVKPM